MDIADKIIKALNEERGDKSRVGARVGGRVGARRPMNEESRVSARSRVGARVGGRVGAYVSARSRVGARRPMFEEDGLEVDESSIRGIVLDVLEELGLVDEVNEETKKVVRDGKVVKKNVHRRKVAISIAQRRALVKARKKAHTASANKARKASNKVRKQKGLKEECSVCGSTTFLLNEESGHQVCADCGTILD